MHPLRAIVALLLLAACTPAPSGGPADAGNTEPPDAGVAPHPLCVDGVSVDGAYPKVEYRFGTGETPPDLSFASPESGGGTRTISLHDAFDPCAEKPKLLVIRVGAAWCATCRWSLAHTSELADPSFAERLRWLDLVVADEDNRPADAATLDRWRAQLGAGSDVALDPAFSFAPLNLAHEPLPYFVVLDTSTMHVRYAAGNPSPEALARRLAEEVARLDHTEATTLPKLPLFDERFTAQEWDLLHEMRLPDAPPPDPSNAVADDARAAALGKKLFSDTGLSPSGTVACATCHDPAKHFTDERPTSVAVATGDRNAPSVLFAAHARWQFWDGRADTLWMQATGPFENEKEFASSRLFVAHRVAADDRAEYEAIFGALPPLEDGARFPASGKPGDPAWDGMSPGDRELANRVYVNVAKAIAAYERTLRAKPNRLDAYLGGQLDALTDAEKRGAKVFLSAGCIQCHSGPRLTDDAFHVVRFPTGRQDGAADRGRIDGLGPLVGAAFNAGGSFSDDPASGARLVGLVADPRMLGAMKTPPLRGVATTGPWGHGGTFSSLRDAVANYATRGLPPTDPRAAGESEPWLPRFAPAHINDIVPFLEVLVAEPAP